MMESSQQQRPSAIPVSTTPSKLRINRAFSKSNDGNLNEQPSSLSDLDMFTLLEENSELKETKEQLTRKNNEFVRRQHDMEDNVDKMSKQIDQMTNQQRIRDEQLHKILEKLQIEVQERLKLQIIQQQQNNIIKDLKDKLRIQEYNHIQLIEVSKQAKSKLEELVPDNEYHLDSEGNVKKSNDDDFSSMSSVPFTMEQLVNDIGNIRTHLNATELQLYEANEKIAELLENQQQLEKENESLKVENFNLTKVAKLMTSSMKESVDTSKKMERAFIRMKEKNDELVKVQRDSVDSPVSPNFLAPNEHVLQLKDELNKKDLVHSERIVEMTKLMESTIESNQNEEILVLRLKLEVIEKELQLALKRAESAEAELAAQKSVSPNSVLNKIQFFQNNGIATTSCLYSIASSQEQSTLQQSSKSAPPPPPPPPMPKFNLPPTNITKSGTSLNDSISTFEFNKLGSDINNPHNQQVKATGMDALICELRNKSVTLRRRNNQRKSKSNNAALQEMFETLELSRAQNRSSKILVNSHLNIVLSTQESAKSDLETASSSQEHF